MFVIITGGGRTGSHLAALLLAQKHEVRLIEDKHDVLSRIHHELPTDVIYQGNPTEPQVLEQAGISRAQVLAACAAEDADNLAVCFLARTRYKVPRTIGRINNPRNAWLFGPTFHVDVSLNQADIMAKLIEEEMSLGDMMVMLKLRQGKYSFVEEKLFPGARAVGVAIKDLPLPHHCIISGILRGGEMVLPRGTEVLREGDEVLALVDDSAHEVLARLLGRPDKA